MHMHTICSSGLHSRTNKIESKLKSNPTTRKLSSTDHAAIVTRDLIRCFSQSSKAADWKANSKEKSGTWHCHFIQKKLVNSLILIKLTTKYFHLCTNAIINFKYRKVASSNMSRLEAHAGFFRLLMKGIFDPYVL